jgi:hypothetical protein
MKFGREFCGNLKVENDLEAISNHPRNEESESSPS